MPIDATTTIVEGAEANSGLADRKSTRLNSSHMSISYAVFCLKKKNNYSRGTRCEGGKNKQQTEIGIVSYVEMAYVDALRCVQTRRSEQYAVRIHNDDCGSQCV